MLAQTVAIAVIPFTGAYPAAKTYLSNDADLKTELGNITGFERIPAGGVQYTADSRGEYTIVTINLTVKGDRKFKDVTIYVVKNADSPDWKVEGIK